MRSEWNRSRTESNVDSPAIPIDPPILNTVSGPKDIADAVVYLTEAIHVTGEVLHVDDGAHVGRW